VDAIPEAGAPGRQFHDLRHTGDAGVSESGATLRVVTDRLGQASTRAALIYLHKRDGRDRKIADALSSMLGEARKAKTTEGNNVDSQTETEPTPERPKQTKRAPEAPAFGPLFLAPDAELNSPDDDGELGGLEPTGS
jgi:hypothetical protein